MLVGFSKFNQHLSHEADCILATYDLSRVESLKKIMKWLRTLLENDYSQPIIITGLKNDLLQKSDQDFVEKNEDKILKAFKFVSFCRR